MSPYKNFLVIVLQVLSVITLGLKNGYPVTREEVIATADSFAVLYWYSWAGPYT